MCGQMRGERIERPLDQIVVPHIRNALETSEPCRTLPVVGEQAVHVGADHPAIGRNRAVR